MEPTINQLGQDYREKIYDFGANLTDCRYYIHEQKYENGEWITIKKYWR